MNERVDHPTHYNAHPSGVECITVVEHFNFNIGNAIKYLWRSGRKHGVSGTEDLQKAAWYITREIERCVRGAEMDVQIGMERDALVAENADLRRRIAELEPPL